MKSSKLTAAIIGFIAMVATVLIYVLFSDDIFGTTIVWLSMVMLLISEAVFTVKAICTQSSIIAQSSIVISAAHFALTLLLALIFIFAFEDSIKTYVILNILALCGALAVDAAIFHFSSAVSASNKKLAQSQSVVLACAAKAQNMATVYAQTPYARDLVEITELLKYSDNSELTGDEMPIMNKLDELEISLSQGTDNVGALITETQNLIKLRSLKMTNIKRGSC